MPHNIISQLAFLWVVCTVVQVDVFFLFLLAGEAAPNSAMTIVLDHIQESDYEQSHHKAHHGDENVESGWKLT